MYSAGVRFVPIQDPMARMVHEPAKFAKMVELDWGRMLTVRDGRWWDHDVRYGRRTMVVVMTVVSTARARVATRILSSHAMRAVETSTAPTLSTVPPGTKQRVKQGALAVRIAMTMMVTRLCRVYSDLLRIPSTRQVWQVPGKIIQHLPIWRPCPDVVWRWWKGIVRHGTWERRCRGGTGWQHRIGFWHRPRSVCRPVEISEAGPGGMRVRCVVHDGRGDNRCLRKWWLHGGSYRNYRGCWCCCNGLSGRNRHKCLWHGEYWLNGLHGLHRLHLLHLLHLLLLGLRHKRHLNWRKLRLGLRLRIVGRHLGVNRISIRRWRAVCVCSRIGPSSAPRFWKSIVDYWHHAWGGHWVYWSGWIRTHLVSLRCDVQKMNLSPLVPRNSAHRRNQAARNNQW